MSHNNRNRNEYDNEYENEEFEYLYENENENDDNEEVVNNSPWECDHIPEPETVDEPEIVYEHQPEPESKPVTEEEMEKEYNKYMAKLMADRRAMAAEIDNWIASGHKVTGPTLEAEYEEMKRQQRDELAAWDAARKAEITKEEEARRQIGRERFAQANSWKPSTHQRDKANGPNAKGKLQGKQQQAKLALQAGPAMSKNAIRKERKAAEAEAAKANAARIAQLMGAVEDKPKTKSKVVKVDDLLGEKLPEQDNEIVELAAAPKFEIELAPKAKVTPKIEAPKVETPKVEIAVLKVEAPKIEDQGWQVVGQNKRVKCDDPVNAVRNEGFKTLASASTAKADDQKCTRLCSSVLDGTRCPYGNRCRFGHRVRDLVQRPCCFGPACRLAKRVAPGVYKNCGDKRCDFWHPEETCDSYSVRMGISVAPAVSKTAPVPVATAQHRSRWDQPANTVTVKLPKNMQGTEAAKSLGSNRVITWV